MAIIYQSDHLNTFVLHMERYIHQGHFTLKVLGQILLHSSLLRGFTIQDKCRPNTLASLLVTGVDSDSHWLPIPLACFPAEWICHTRNIEPHQRQVSKDGEYTRLLLDCRAYLTGGSRMVGWTCVSPVWELAGKNEIKLTAEE